MAGEAVHQSMNIDLSHSPCNSSPLFLFETPSFVCLSASTVMSLAAYDLDGDSLSYSLVACQKSDTASNLYGAGYSPQQPMGPQWDVQLDSITGELIIDPNPGSVWVSATICVQVEEFRNGLSLGTITHDFALGVYNTCTSGGPNNKPIVDQLQVLGGGTLTGAREITMCESDTLVFQVSAYDTDQNQILIVDSLEDFPGLTVTYSGSNPILTEYTLVTDRTTDFHFPIMVWDNHCPIRGNTLDHILIKVRDNCLGGTITDADCGTAQGAIDLDVWGGLPPFQFLWSTGDTTEDISNIVPGMYSVQVTDANNRIFIDSFLVNSISISINPILTLPNCMDQQGMIHTAITGAVPPYTYQWNTGATSDSLANLSSGGYSLTITDSLGCPRHEAFVLKRPDSCFNIIQGRYYEDRNGNCQFDGNDLAKPYEFIHVVNGTNVFTDKDGFYRLELETGPYLWEVFPTRWQHGICPPSLSYQETFTQTGGKLLDKDFAIETDSVIEQRISYSMSRPRPGFSVAHILKVHNGGNLPTNSRLTWTHDSIFQFSSAIPTPTAYDPISRTASWDFSTFQAYDVRVLTYIPSTVRLNRAFANQAIVYPIVGDTIPANNVVDLGGWTVGSFDPNDKQVRPAGEGALGFVPLETQALTYTVRFQNTGTDTAFFVVIRDTIDPHLDIFSYQREMESHPYHLQILEDSILVFTFNHINLPDSARDLAGSQGFVQFTLQAENNLLSGTQIRNRAAIYFDFNEPIITNEVLNTFANFPKVSLGEDSSFCAGESLTAVLTEWGTPPYTFSWSNGIVDANNFTGQSTIQPNSSGLYQLTVTDSLGISDVQQMHVIILPPPDASFSFQPNGLFTLFNCPSAANINWVWDFGDGKRLSGQQNPVHMYGASGSYLVTLITESHCGFDTMSQTVTISSMSIDENKLTAQPHIVPHPVKDVSYLQFENAEHQLYQLQIFDLWGRRIKTYPPHRGDAFEIRKNELATGIFMFELKMVNSSNSHFGKIIVK
jgi:PKD repeat protein